MLQDASQSKPVTYLEARAIMGENFYGMAELFHATDNVDRFTEVDEEGQPVNDSIFESIRNIPFPRWRLERDKATHVLVLYHPAYITGIPPIDGICWCLVEGTKFDRSTLRLDFSADHATQAA